MAALIGACFIVNYVTADSKTNWAEGMSMVIFYAMIVSYTFHLQILYYSDEYLPSRRLFAHGSIRANLKLNSCHNVLVWLLLLLMELE